MMTPEKQTVFEWIGQNRSKLSEHHLTIWHYAEPAWREYRSAAFFVDLLRKEGFDVEAGSATMPTAFCATFGSGKPVLGAYAEYDAVPGMSQAAVTHQKPRDGFHRTAAGHTDPHSALGIGALTGVLAAKAAMERHHLPGTIKFFGEPAEKVCGSKPVHAVHGYYDNLDAAISFHPTSLPALANSTVWDTHCGAYWSKIYTFECVDPETWGSAGSREGTNNSHTTARAPAALDAVCLMYTTTKYTKEAMLPHRGTWTLNEFILVAGQATSDNLAPTFSQIQYSWRCPSLDMAERILDVLERNARHVAELTHCRVSSDWVTRTRVGLPNHAMAEITYRNLELAGPPSFGDEAKAFAREIQKTLGLAPMDDPFMPEISALTPPQVGEARLRQSLPPWQTNYTSDDYVEYTWHAPTSRLYIGRAMLRPPSRDYRYPDWPRNALGGYPPAIDPLWYSAGRTIGATLVELMTSPAEVARARTEFVERTGGGIGGSKWVAPLLPKGFRAPVHYRWPEYVTTARGEEWWIPNEPGAAPAATQTAADRADHDRVVRFVAKHRFPFPGQTDWPPDNVTVTNETSPQRGIPTPAGVHYPDIVVVSKAGTLREVAEVETELTEQTAKVWSWGSAASDTKTKTGVRHFFVYVPAGLGEEAQRLLGRHQISYAGLRTWEIDADGRILIVPVTTLGDAKDHVESAGTD